MKTRDIFTILLSFIIPVLFQGIALAQSDTIHVNQHEKILGVGLRFSNPEGLSIKSYNKNKAIEFLVGRDNPWRAKNYYYRSYNQFRHIDANGWYEHKRPWSFTFATLYRMIFHFSGDYPGTMELVRISRQANTTIILQSEKEIPKYISVISNNTLLQVSM